MPPKNPKKMNKAEKQAAKAAQPLNRAERYTKVLEVNVKIIELQLWEYLSDEVKKKMDDYVEKGIDLEVDFPFSNFGRTLEIRMYNTRGQRSYSKLVNTNETLDDDRVSRNYDRLEARLKLLEEGKQVTSVGPRAEPEHVPATGEVEDAPIKPQETKVEEEDNSEAPMLVPDQAPAGSN
jgi:hypothetical protein